MKLFSKGILVLIALAVSSCGQRKIDTQPLPSNRNDPLPAKGLLVRYIANMGVLLSSGDKQVLIDAVHRKYKPAYVFPPPELLGNLESARAPYDSIELVLVTHMHLDHFHPESVGLHLKNDPKSILVSSAQVVEEIWKGFTDHEKIKAHIKEVTPEWDKRTDLEVNGIKLSLLGLRHVNAQHRSVQNLGYMVEIGGKKVLHVGDAELTTENFAAFQLEKENIDVAILPQWFLEQSGGCEMVRKLIGAKNVIATHISAGYTDEVAARVKKDCAGADAFTKILEERIY
jgi:L-ascorbate metabolism protein UlaG (beta-lactamase superfamily)